MEDKRTNIKLKNNQKQNITNFNTKNTNIQTQKTKTNIKMKNNKTQ